MQKTYDVRNTTPMNGIIRKVEELAHTCKLAYVIDDKKLGYRRYGYDISKFGTEYLTAEVLVDPKSSIPVQVRNLKYSVEAIKVTLNLKFGEF